MDTSSIRTRTSRVSGVEAMRNSFQIQFGFRIEGRSAQANRRSTSSRQPPKSWRLATSDAVFCPPGTRWTSPVLGRTSSFATLSLRSSPPPSCIGAHSKQPCPVRQCNFSANTHYGRPGPLIQVKLVFFFPIRPPRRNAGDKKVMRITEIREGYPGSDLPI